MAADPCCPSEEEEECLDAAHRRRRRRCPTDGDDDEDDDDEPYSSSPLSRREQRQQARRRRRRRASVLEARRLLCGLPHCSLHEVAGRPHVVYELRDYSQAGGAERARLDLPFLFRPFEVGQAPPPSRAKKPKKPKQRQGMSPASASPPGGPPPPAAAEMGSPPAGDGGGAGRSEEDGDGGGENSEAAVPRQATIHEYLDWTVTAAPAEGNDEFAKDQDFDGFRVIVLLARFRPGWPPPGAYEGEGTKVCQQLGAPKNPLPVLLVEGKPVSAATIRSGRGFLEVPFFATREGRRGKGFGRCLLEAIEDVARACGAVRLLLCSTDDEDTKATWRHLGFVETGEEDLRGWGVGPTDLLHMTNTVQMHKEVAPARHWKSLIIRHESFVQRTYFTTEEPSQMKRNSHNKEMENGNSVHHSPNNMQY